MSLADIVSNFFLFFIQPSTAISVLIMGYLWFNSERENILRLILIWITSLLLNWALKTTFQIPLPEGFNKLSFAFPSGHMQASAVFYGTLCMFIPSLLFRYSVLVILTGIGFGLIHCGYHTIYDVVGALVVSGLLLLLIAKSKQYSFKTLLLITLLCSSGLMLYTHYVYKLTAHAWNLFFALSGLICLEHLLKTRQIILNFKQKTLATIFYLSAIAIYFIFKEYIGPFKFWASLNSLTLPLSVKIFSYCLNKKNDQRN